MHARSASNLVAPRASSCSRSRRSRAPRRAAIRRSRHRASCRSDSATATASSTPRATLALRPRACGRRTMPARRSGRRERDRPVSWAPRMRHHPRRTPRAACLTGLQRDLNTARGHSPRAHRNGDRAPRVRGEEPRTRLAPRSVFVRFRIGCASDLLDLGHDGGHLRAPMHALPRRHGVLFGRCAPRGEQAGHRRAAAAASNDARPAFSVGRSMKRAAARGPRRG